MTQTLEILLGMAIFYFAFSSRFRKFVKKCINSWTRKNDAPIISKPIMTKKPEISNRGGLVVDEDTLAEWTKNPDVKVRE